MQNSNPPSANPEQGEKLELPVDPRFVSKLPKVDFQDMVRRMEENLANRSSKPGASERRWREKVHVEFVLKD